MRFENGSLFCIDTRSGIYQILDFHKEDEKGSVYYCRKVFDDKFNLKVSKADLVHSSWMVPISQQVQEKLNAVLAEPAIKETLNDLTIQRAIQYGTRGTEHFSNMIWFSMNPKNKKNIEKQINGAIDGFVDFDCLRKTVSELEERGELIPSRPGAGKSGDMRVYRLELGRYIDDCDDAGNECYRNIRFYEMKN